MTLGRKEKCWFQLFMFLFFIGWHHTRRSGVWFLHIAHVCNSSTEKHVLVSARPKSVRVSNCTNLFAECPVVTTFLPSNACKRVRVNNATMQFSFERPVSSQRSTLSRGRWTARSSEIVWLVDSEANYVNQIVCLNEVIAFRTSGEVELGAEKVTLGK